MRLERKDLVPCEDHDAVEGFYVFPGDSKFSVNRAGIVYDREKKEYAQNSLSHNENNSHSTYVSVRGIPLHRLVAETFLDQSHIPENQFAIVNHINGDHTDNRLVNLEWTTYQGNAIHAYATGLRSDNIQVLCKDLRDGSVKRYYSYGDCARGFGVSPSHVFVFLNAKTANRVWQEYFYLIKLGQEWPHFGTDYLERCVSYKNREMFLVDNDTSKAIVFRNSQDLCEFTNMANSIMSKKLKEMTEKNEKSFIWRNWTIMRVKDAETWMREQAEDRTSETKPSKIVSYSGRRKPSRISVKCLESQEVKEYPSLEEFSTIIGQKKNTVQKHILMNKGMWRGLFEIKYL